MRSKEEAHDYRYFPEPDLAPLVVSRQFIDDVTDSMPELPDVRRNRFMEKYGLSFSDATQLNSDRALADYYEAVAWESGNPRAASNWIRSELLRQLETAGKLAADSPVSPQALAVLIRMVEDGKINGNQAKEVLAEMFASGRRAEEIIEEKGFVQVSDVSEIEGIVDEVLAANSKQLEQYRAGKEALFGFFVGQVMKASKGKANPKVANDVLARKLKA
jgi:aspartyl-tRNA(Asn)/glutamyl-tRNA(Gln) amidotransferase subunit B